MKGDVTVQRRWEAYDKLGSFVVYVVSFVLTIQAIGLESELAGLGVLCFALLFRPWVLRVSVTAWLVLVCGVLCADHPGDWP